MKSIIFSLFLAGAGLFHQARAQSVSPEVIAGAGQHSTTPNAQVSWTVGEMATATLSSSSEQLTQGFHQTRLVVTAVEEELATLEIQVFPNPTSDVLYVRTESARTLDIQLIDMSGKVLAEQLHEQQVQSMLDLNMLSQGNYILQARDRESQAFRRFKIQVIATH
jgi:hypothetical protein